MVFLLGVVGFGIALMGLFNSDNTSGFPNVKESFFTLFASGMGMLFLIITCLFHDLISLMNITF